MPDDHITPEHIRFVKTAYKVFTPAHGQRESDPHYHLFNEYRRQLKAADKLVCWRCESRENIQIHHSVLEWSLLNGISLEKVKQKCPELNLTDQESLLAWAETEGNLLPLCQKCHTGEEGIHFIPDPDWLPGRYWRDDLVGPAKKIDDGEATTQ